MAEPSMVFISYAREDEQAARDLYKRLVNAGLNPWLDREKLIGGEDWDRAIRAALKSSDFVVLCLSGQSVTKRGYLQREFKLALDATQTMLASDIYLLPVRLDRCDVPEELAHLQWIDLYKSEGWHQMLTALRTGTERRSSAQAAIQAQRNEAAANALRGHERPEPSFAEIGSLAPALPRGITRPGRLRSLLAAQNNASLWLIMLIGSVLLAAGNASVLAGRSELILRGVVNAEGFAGLRFLYEYHYVIAVATIVTGGLLLCAGVLNLFYHDNLAKRVKLLGWGVFSVVILSIANLLSGPFVETQFEPVVEQAVSRRLPNLYTRIERVWESSGGFRSEYPTDSRTQPWTTAQLLSAILQHPSSHATEFFDQDQLWQSMEYLESTRRDDGDGGGWGYWPENGPTITEISGWIAVAQSAALRHSSGNLFQSPRRATLTERLTREVDVLISRQMDHGAWGPVAETREARTYSTLMAVWGLIEAASVLPAEQANRALVSTRDGIEWLLQNRDATIGWSPRPRPGREAERFPGLTAQVAYVLARALQHEFLAFIRTDPNFIDTTNVVLSVPLSPNQSFASLDRRTPDADVHMTDSAYVLEGSTFLMYPWTIATLTDFTHLEGIDAAQRERAARRRLELLLRWDDIDGYVNDGYPYMLAETLLAAAHSVPGDL